MRVINRGKNTYKDSEVVIPVGQEVEITPEKYKELMTQYSCSKAFKFEAVEGKQIEVDYQKELLKLIENCDEKVTVLMPVFNNQEYVASAIESILNQTYKNIELLIWNDGSTDKTKDILKKYKKQDKRVRVLYCLRNNGVGNARRMLIKNCETRLACWMDSDDIAHPRKLEVQLAAILELEKHGHNKFLVGTSWEGFKDNLDLKVMGNPTEKELEYLQINNLMFEVDKIVLPNNGIEAMNWGEDRDWKNKAVEAGYVIAHVPLLLHFYRNHEASLTSQYHRKELKPIEVK